MSSLLLQTEFKNLTQDLYIPSKYPTCKPGNEPLATTSSSLLPSFVMYFRNRGALGSIWRNRTETHPSMANDPPLNTPSQCKFYWKWYHPLPWKQKNYNKLYSATGKKTKPKQYFPFEAPLWPRKTRVSWIEYSSFYSSFRDLPSFQLMISKPKLC